MTFRIGAVILSIASAVVTYDWALTFDQEVELIWNQSFSIGTILFVLNRYLPFLDVAVGMNSLFYNESSVKSCRERFRAMIWTVVAGVLVSQMVLALRTAAIWGRRKTIVIILGISFLCTCIPLVVVTSLLVLPSLDFHEGVGCHIANSSNIIAIPYIIILVSETVICFLSLLRTYQYVQHTASNWVHHLHKQGFMFYCCMLAISLTNALYPFYVQPSSKYNLAFLQHAAHSVFCNHVIFLIMEQRKQMNIANQEITRSIPLTTFMLDDMYSTNNELLL